jgi:uncharacterized protein YcbK (DUF882 family)
MPRPSLHLSWSELACHDGTPYPAAWGDRARALADVFEDFRHALGGDPIIIGSAYRTAPWNRKCGGSQRSQHLYGRALDCYPPAAMFLTEFREKAKTFALADERIGGIGFYRWGVHWDIRPRGHRLITWNQIPAGTLLHDQWV